MAHGPAKLLKLLYFLEIHNSQEPLSRPRISAFFYSYAAQLLKNEIIKQIVAKF